MRFSLKLLFGICVIASLSACEMPEVQSSGKIQAPEIWQTHLKTTTLASTMSVRNTDPKNRIYVTSMAYHGTDGKLVEELCTQPIILEPMATADIVVPRKNTSGGSGANFLVKWVSDKEACAPIVEAVMISAGASRNISFVSRGVVTESIAGDK